ncbi:MAG: hypothetical protein GY788_08490 [bacterium]|nr:hypothetical protein [bacterium]
MIEPRPHGFQKENHLIDDDYYWTKQREASWDELQAALDPTAGPLWDNSSSSYNGLNDRIEEAAANELVSSLRLVEVNDLKIAVAVEGAEFGNAKRKVRGHFTFKGTQHWFSVTDPAVEKRYLRGNDGEFEVGKAILCISLGEPYGGYAYKLIAGVFVRS